MSIMMVLRLNGHALWVLQTVNDVALGITQAGLSRYLNRKYGNFLSQIITLINNFKIITLLIPW